MVAGLAGSSGFVAWTNSGVGAGAGGGGGVARPVFRDGAGGADAADEPVEEAPP